MPATPGKSTNRQVWLLPAVSLAVVAALVVAIWWFATGSGQETEDGAAAETAVQDQQVHPEFERRDPDDPFSAGPVDAPVGLVVFSDYQCPYCAQWNHQTMPAMMDKAEAGELRIEWRDVNILGPESELAARASYAAALQDSYWEYHDALFAGGDRRPANQLTEDGLVGIAGELGLDEEQFREDLDSSEARTTVAQNEQFGRSLGVPSTPVFILAGEPIAGAQPPEVFVEAVERALAENE